MPFPKYGITCKVVGLQGSRLNNTKVEVLRDTKYRKPADLPTAKFFVRVVEGTGAAASIKGQDFEIGLVNLVRCCFLKGCMRTRADRPGDKINKQLFRCCNCLNTLYCSVAHQVLDWNREDGHSVTCFNRGKSFQGERVKRVISAVQHPDALDHCSEFKDLLKQLAQAVRVCGVSGIEDDYGLAQSGCECVDYLASITSALSVTLDDLGDAGLCEAIVILTSCHEGLDENVLEPGLSAIQKLAKSQTNCRKLLLDTPAICEILSDCIFEFSRNNTLQIQALEIIQDFTAGIAENQEEVEAFHASLVAAGVISRIGYSMDHSSPDFTGFSIRGWEILRVLTLNRDLNGDECNAIAEGFNNCLRKPPVSAISLGVMAALSSDPENRRSFGDAGLCDSVVELLQRSTSVEVSEPACLLLHRLTIDDIENTESLIDLDACDALWAAVHSFPTCNGVICNALHALSNIAHCNTSQRVALRQREDLQQVSAAVLESDALSDDCKAACRAFLLVLALESARQDDSSDAQKEKESSG